MPAEKVSVTYGKKGLFILIYCQTGQTTATCTGLATLKHSGLRKEKPMKELGYKKLKILSSFHTWFITNLPKCSSAPLTSSPDLCMEVLFELQTGFRCVPLKTGENSY